MTRTSRFARSLVPTSTDLRRAARFHADAEGWKLLELGDVRPGDGGAPGEVRAVVSGTGLPGLCTLRVRERLGADPPRDARVRRDAATEHVVGVVRELPPRRVRQREWDAVLLQHAPIGLDTLLLRQGGLRGGEASTILLGVAAGVAALHASGWARPDLSASGVVFATDGCPALDALDATVSWEPEAAVADAGAFYSLAHRVCLTVTDGSGMRLLSAIEAGLRRGTWRALEEAVLAVASPEPVALSAAGGQPLKPPVENRPGAVWLSPSTWRRTSDATGGAAPSRAGRASVGRVKGRAAASVAAAMAFLDGEPARVVGRRLGVWLRRRPAVVIAGLVPLAAALAVVALVPAAPADSATAADRAGDRSMGGSPAAGVASGGGAVAPQRSSATPSPWPSVRAVDGPIPSSPPAPPTKPPAAGTPGTGPDAAVGTQADDPVVAAGSLLEARHACFTARPTAAECLSTVLDGEPAFIAQETQALKSTGAAEARDYGGAALSLVERWGDAALIGVVPDPARTPHSEHASFLLVESDSGWRLRAVFP